MSGRELQLRAARLAITVPWTAAEIRNLAVAGGPAFLIPAFSLTDAIGPATEAFKFLLEQLKEQGFEPDGPGCFKKESGTGGVFGFPDDATAPSVAVSVDAQGCCDPLQSPADKLGGTSAEAGDKGVGCKGQKGGICVRFGLEVSDDTGILSGSDSGVRKISICSLVPGPAGVSQGPCRDITLTDSESDGTEGGKLKLTAFLCVPCDFVKDNVLHFSVRVADDDDNERLYFKSCAVPEELRRGCC